MKIRNLGKPAQNCSPSSVKMCLRSKGARTSSPKWRRNIKWTILSSKLRREWNKTTLITPWESQLNWPSSGRILKVRMFRNYIIAPWKPQSLGTIPISTSFRLVQTHLRWRKWNSRELKSRMLGLLRRNIWHRINQAILASASKAKTPWWAQ